MTIFVDTSALYALLDRDDQMHRRAAETWERLLRDGSVVITTNYVVVETSALVQRRLGGDAVQALHTALLPLLSIEWIGEAVHSAAVQVLLGSARRKLSLVDCTSFPVMRAAGAGSAFCFDAHFRQQGFELLG